MTPVNRAAAAGTTEEDQGAVALLSISFLVVQTHLFSSLPSRPTIYSRRLVHHQSVSRSIRGTFPAKDRGSAFRAADFGLSGYIYICLSVH